MWDFRVVFYHDGQAWIAHALNVEVCTFGDTLEEARANIVEALELYFDDATPEDLEWVIDVRDPIVETVSVNVEALAP